jgi:hypothetical protein
MPVVTLVVSPITVRPVAGFCWGWKNSQADDERAKENPKFVHNKAPAFGCAEIAVLLSNESR